MSVLNCTDWIAAARMQVLPARVLSLRFETEDSESVSGTGGS
jgi:hypothetical protein